MPFKPEAVAGLGKVAAMLEERAGDLAEFLAQDPKGKMLPGYLKELTRGLLREQQELQGELESLGKYVEHIKVIVAMQQSYAKVGGALEKLDFKELMEDALQINSAAYESHQIQFIRDYQPVPRVLVDRHKVLQILVNLLSNAQQALEPIAPDQRRVILSISLGSADRVCLRVSDNGMGIEPHNLSNIFALGFTTKKNGHGFGLHNGANAAKEMRGLLCAQSDGPGHGAVFTLELPIAKPGASNGN